MSSSKNQPYTIGPASLPQEQFLASDSTITLYSGSAGAGKTFAIILNMVKFAARRNSTIIVFRRTSTQIKAGGSIWSEAVPVFRKMFPDARIRNRDLEIYIPSTNSSVKFSHLQYSSDVLNHLGSQYSVIIYDEVTTFPFEEFVLPLMGRMRNANVDYTPQMFWATNPQYGHGVHKWIKDFYLDEEGIPIPERSNIERYFVLKDGFPVWYDSREEAEALHGKGMPRSFRSIRAHVTDNKPLLKANPDYIANLLSLSPVKKKIYYDGSWEARLEEESMFKKDWVEMVDYPNGRAGKRVRAWDLAATLPSPASPDPDWTRGTLVSKDRDSYYTVEDIVSLRDRPHKVEELIYKTALSDPEGTVQVIPVDVGAAGIAYANTIKKRLAELGIECRLDKMNKSKRTRFMPVSSLAQAGWFKVVRADWNDTAFEELERFNGEKHNGHDDICDTLSTAVSVLNKGLLEIPSFTLPDFSMPNPYKINY